MSLQDQKDLLIISKHIELDISYGAEGTFNKDRKGALEVDVDFDDKEAEMVRNALRRIAKKLNKLQ